MDRGYLDYALCSRWTAAGLWFVTRPRTNMLYCVIERRLVPSRGPVLDDEVIELTSEHAAARCTVPLRRVVVWDATKAQELAFLTNIHYLTASTLAKIY